ncbi:hypothetical protein ACRAWF_09320 [Streptomyces sp. L7]
MLTEAMLGGVTVVDPATTWIDVTVTFDQDATIQPGTQLHGATHIGEERRGRPQQPPDGHRRRGRRPRDNTVAVRLAHRPAGLRRAVRLPAVPARAWARSGKIGTYVETKNATIGGTKIPHLSYVGDATIGDYSNIGAASVFVNYDGQAKHHTTVGSHCRTGSDQYVCGGPVTVGTAHTPPPASVITKDVPPGFAGRGPWPAAEYRGLGGPQAARKRGGEGRGNRFPPGTANETDRKRVRSGRRTVINAHPVE